MTAEKHDAHRNVVRDSYAKVATTQSGCCGPAPAAVLQEQAAQGLGCCTPGVATATADQMATIMGYDAADLKLLPEGANMGLGCGNPVAIAALKEGETVVDLGSGGGIDCFLAAKAVGPSGRVIGVDMTPEMISKARENAAKGGLAHAEFRLGEIEHLPIADNTADVVLSNCVINLSPDKAQVFKDVFRVLKPGGRISVSDIVALKPLPEDLAKAAESISGCVGAAALIDEVKAMMTDAGFVGISVQVKEESRDFIKNWLPGSGAETYVASAAIEAVKP